MRGTIAALAALVAFGAPALAQTDDRVLNDVVTVLSSHALIRETAAQCAVATGGDAEVAAAFAGFEARSTAWLVIATSLVGSRPGMPEGAIAAAREQTVQNVRRNFGNDQTPAESCRNLAQSLDGAQMDLEKLNPAETARMSRARAGELPPLDVDNSAEVGDAMAMKRAYYLRQAMLNQCSSTVADESRIAAARQGYEERNFSAYLLAHKVMVGWGALHPEREQSLLISTEFAASAEVEAGGAARCEAFLAALETGGEDVVVLEAERMGRLRRAERNLP